MVLLIGRIEATERSQRGTESATTETQQSAASAALEAYGRARWKRWRIRYGAPVSSERLGELGRFVERLSVELGAPVERVSELAMVAYLRQPGRSDGALETKRHPLGWWASYASELEAAVRRGLEERASDVRELGPSRPTEEGLSHGDYARAAAELARASSTIPTDGPAVVRRCPPDSPPERAVR
jgi:hypothetical protein